MPYRPYQAFIFSSRNTHIYKIIVNSGTLEDCQSHLNMISIKINYVIGMVQNKSSKIAAAALVAALSAGPVMGIAGAATNSVHSSTELSALKRPDASKNATTSLSIRLIRGNGVSSAEFNSLKNAVLSLYNGSTEKVKLKGGMAVVKNLKIASSGYDISLWGINKSDPFAQTPLKGSTPSWWYSMAVSVKGPAISVLHEPLKQYPSSTPWIKISGTGKNQAVYLTVSKVSAPKSSTPTTTTAPPSTTSTTLPQSAPTTAAQ